MEIVLHRFLLRFLETAGTRLAACLPEIPATDQDKEDSDESRH